MRKGGGKRKFTAVNDLLGSLLTYIEKTPGARGVH